MLFTVVAAAVSSRFSGSVIAEDHQTVSEATDLQSIEEDPITESDRDHWAFHPLDSSEIPEVATPSWCRTPIDRYVLSRLERKGIHGQPDASRRVLIRRLSITLLGIPPTPEQVDRFERDKRPDAYERLVDQMLASPRYGEHVAQYWLDLARFAETDGFEHDKVRATAWRYRDWVIKSFNRGESYDKFLSLQLAGDLVDNGVHRDATAFVLSGPDMPDINSQEERRHSVLNELTGTVGEVTLGLQLGCAQCHDHKYDPISQADFFRFRAIFESAVSVEKNKSLTTLRESNRKDVPRLWVRGDWRRPGPHVQPAFPRVVTTGTSLIDGAKSHPRLALAEWLASDAAPTVARVMVNRVWAWHFGRGLSETPNDVGLVGHTPRNRELLDRLATDFCRDWDLKRLQRTIVLSSVFRQSSVRRPDVSHDAWAKILDRDPNNVWLSRFPRQRMRAEVVRDSILSTSGSISLKQFGPGVRPALPAELTSTLLRKQWEVTPNEGEHVRRSVYIFARRNLRYPVLEAFDRPEANASCGQRAVSTTAPQALFMLNSQFAWQAGGRLAARVREEIPSSVASGEGPEPAARIDGERIRSLFRYVLCREPTDQEAAESRAFLAQSEHLDTGVSDGLQELALVLYNASEFYYLD